MLTGMLRHRQRELAWLTGWSAVQALPALASGWVLAEATGMFLSGRTTAGLGWLGLLCVAAVAGAFGTRQCYLCLGGIVEPLRDELVSGVVRGALGQSGTAAGLPGTAAGLPGTDAVARLTHQAEIVRDACAGLLTVASTFAVTSVSTVAGLATLVPAVIPYVIPPLAASLLILRLLLRPFADRQRWLVIGEERVAGSAAAAVSGLRDVVACGAEATVLAGLDDQVRQQARAAAAVARVSAARVLCLAASGWLPLVLVLLAAPSLVHGGVTPAHLVGAIGYIGGSLRSTLATLAQGLGAGMVRLTVTLDRIREASLNTGRPGLGTGWPGPGGLVLREVRFGYGGASPVVRDLSLSIAPGSHMVIVGPSGAGKSSLAGLLAGLLVPDSGEVLLDGVPATGCPPWSRVLIPQEAYVFAGTLTENLTYLRGCDVAAGAGLHRVPHGPVSDAELDAAVTAIGLGPLARRLGGYRAFVQPGRLSAGERQLIALTRAYLSPAPVTILDEATCHLDPAAEARAEAAFIARPGTLIVIAHRISSALRAPRILVLDGASAQAGAHDELLACSPMYRDLVGYWTADHDHGSYASYTTSFDP